MKDDGNKGIVERSPVVAVLGHVDHGKSSLLDYIRKTNVVAGESGGITQHISAYEVTHKNERGEDKKITFLDTPGHAAFSGMRERGAEIADIAILVVSAEDGVKAQTIEAYKTISARGLPFVVAINKIDKQTSDIERTKQSLAENEIYVEGYGGSVACVPISAKTGAGIDDLLSMVILTAELEELRGDANLPGSGFVLESFLDPKRGVSATLIIKDGTLGKGSFILAGQALSPFRIAENFLGKLVSEASFSSPVKVTGWSSIPAAGIRFQSFKNKKEAEEKQEEEKNREKNYTKKQSAIPESENTAILPLVVKADVLGTLEAVEKEIKKVQAENVVIKILDAKVGGISERDVLLASSDKRSVIVGFKVTPDAKAKDQAERMKIPIQTFDVIYKMSEWIETLAKERKPKQEVEEVTGTLRILRTFSQTRDKQVVGGRVLAGSMLNQALVKIIRRGNDIGRGKILELQSQKQKTREVLEGSECGLEVESKMEIAEGDILEAFVVSYK